MIGLKNWKLKKRETKMESTTELQKSNIKAEVYSN